MPSTSQQSEFTERMAQRSPRKFKSEALAKQAREHVGALDVERVLAQPKVDQHLVGARDS